MSAAETRRAAARLGLACSAWLVVACGAPAQPDLLLISVDTLRADRVGLLGSKRPTTPFLDGFFAEGRIYERAYATSASTSPSVVSFLSGLLPQEHGVRLFFQLLPEELKLVSDLLPPAYERAAFVSNMVLTDEATGLAARFDHYDDLVDQVESTAGERNVYERDASRTTDAALAWLAGRREPGRPLFLWVHYIDPHGPYRVPDEASVRFSHREPVPIDPERVPEYQREAGVRDGAYYVDRYDEEVAWTDAQIRRLVEGYADRADVDRALVIFTADHGESMMEHRGWFTHGYQVWEEIMRVPLLLRGPGVERGRSAVPALGTDVAPTLLHAAGVPIPRDMEDVDLRSGRGAAADRMLALEATNALGQWRAGVRGGRKAVIRIRADASRERSYVLDLESDPLELSPRAASSDDPLVAELDRLIAADPDPAGVPADARAGMKLSAPKVARDVDVDTLRRLEALGYATPEAAE